MKIKLARFIEHLKQNPILPINAQECCGKEENFWCADWWTIEVAKCLFFGKAVYTKYDLSPQFRNNRNFSKPNTVDAADRKLRMVEILRSRLDRVNHLFVCEVGRGLDILLAESLKHWETIYCYDSSYRYEAYLKDLWGDRIVFTCCPSIKFDLETLNYKTVAVANHSKTKQLFERMKECNRISYIIQDGKEIKNDS